MRQELVAPFVKEILPVSVGVLKRSALAKRFQSEDDFLNALPPKARARVFGENTGPFGELIAEGSAPTPLGPWYRLWLEKGKISEADHEVALTAEVVGKFPSAVVRAWFGSDEWYTSQSEAARGLKLAVLRLILSAETDSDEIRNLLFKHVEDSFWHSAPREKLEEFGKRSRLQKDYFKALFGMFGLEGIVEYADSRALWAFFEEVLDRRWAEASDSDEPAERKGGSSRRNERQGSDDDSDPALLD